jgi:hypothetical protein
MADYIKDDPETGSFNIAHEVNMFVQKAKEWQSTVQGDWAMYLRTGRACAGYIHSKTVH